MSLRISLLAILGGILITTHFTDLTRPRLSVM
jgi:hypothetical protein